MRRSRSGFAGGKRPILYDLGNAITEATWVFKAQVKIADKFVLQMEEIEAWTARRFGPNALQYYKTLGSEWRNNQEDKYTFNHNADWCKAGMRFLFRDPNHAFEFKMYWG